MKKHRSWFAACILFFYDEALSKAHPAVSNALHAGWLVIHTKPMDAETLQSVPVDYDDDEKTRCKTTTAFLVSKLDAEGRAKRGLAPLPAPAPARARARIRTSADRPGDAHPPADDDDDYMPEVITFRWLQVFALFL